MFGANAEKRHSTPNLVQEPHGAHIDRRDTFLPTYEEHLNDNLRTFGEPSTQTNLNAFEFIEEPECGSRRCMKREYLIVAIIILLICAIALPLGLVYILRDVNAEHQTATLQTRQAESSLSFPPVTTAPLPSTILVPMTVYVTVTPTPQVYIPIVTITVTRSSISAEEQEVSVTKDTAGHTSIETVTSLSLSTVTASTSTKTTPTTPSSVTITSTSISTSAIDPSLMPSLKSEIIKSTLITVASATAKAATESNTTTETSTIVSATTITPPPSPSPSTTSKAMQTIYSGRFGFCGVRGSNC